MCKRVKCKKSRFWGGGSGRGRNSASAFLCGCCMGCRGVGSVVMKEDESKKGGCDQTAKRLVMLRSLVLAAGNERQRNYLRRGGLMPHNCWSSFKKYINHYLKKIS